MFCQERTEDISVTGSLHVQEQLLYSTEVVSVLSTTRSDEDRTSVAARKAGVIKALELLKLQQN